VYVGQLLLIQSQKTFEREMRAWQRLAPNLRNYYIPGTTHRELDDPHIEAICAGFIAQAIRDQDAGK
jgi:hypothetical protein